MANTKSAIKRIRRISKQTSVNKIRKSRFRNAIKKMQLIISKKDKKKALEFLPKLNSELMKVSHTVDTLFGTGVSKNIPKDIDFKMNLKYMVKKTKIVQEKIARVKYLSFLYQIDQLFFVIYVKNNKLCY